MSTEFAESFANDLSNWFVLHKQWGKGNNGVAKDLVKFEHENKQKVLSLYGNGDLYSGDVFGVQKKGGKYFSCSNKTRVGSAIATRNRYGSGLYQVNLKVPNNNPPIGACIAIWTFHYEEHYCKQVDEDLFYQPRYRQGNSNDGFYSTVNAEIDWPEIGASGDLSKAMFSTWTSEIAHQTQSFQIHNILDGKYHTFGLDWKTELVHLPSLCDDEVKEVNGCYYCINPKSSIQGEALRKKNGEYFKCHGKSATFFMDERKIAESFEHVPWIAGRLHIGIWFPDWAGPAKWSQSKMLLSSVSISPYNSEADVYSQKARMEQDKEKSTEVETKEEPLELPEKGEDKTSEEKPASRFSPSPNKILDFLFIGNLEDARNIERLKELGIGHVVNLANGSENPFPEQLKYLKYDVYDSPFQNLRMYFEEVFEFIDQAKDSNSKVLVHCHMGVSRSATICIGYVMKHTGWTLRESYNRVFDARGFIMPNNGFYNQLIRYENELYGKTTLEPMQSLLFYKIPVSNQKEDNKDDADTKEKENEEKVEIERVKESDLKSKKRKQRNAKSCVIM